ncbi:alpha/beta hydrolase [Psychrobacillus sp. FSL K6-2684]|uniref:alpha/beta fold hydrolase n=1 Tax=unclassified Psychrobacillus TaxID=2636677 RepID=UPI001246B74F|nr:alpha/beta hydrolase [Psychrobacillus sp. AK 1817]QEY20075.1 alpha/beta hydrolase [Psychrobacillus sp. AK 1817]
MNDGQLIQINGKELYIEESKTCDKAVLFLHGGPGESCFDFSYHQTSRLGSRFRLITLDQRGVCRSEAIKIEESFCLDDLIEDCEELRKHLEIQEWSIIGHSFGGYLAALYAHRYPNSIEKVIFEAPTFDFELTGKALLRKTADLFEKYGQPHLQEQCMELANSSYSPRLLVEGYAELSSFLNDKRMEIYTSNFDNSTDSTVYTENQWEIFYDKSEVHFNRLREEGSIFKSALHLLKEINIPCLLILGEHDVVTCPIQIEVFNKDLRQGEVVLIENCGHSPHFETPEQYCEIVTEYLLR